MTFTLTPIGEVRTEASKLPRHYTVSDVTGQIVVNPAYAEGLRDILPGQKIVVLFIFDRSETFTPQHLVQTPPHTGRETGVFSICSPVRPNPIGLSVLTVTAVSGNVLSVTGLDMMDKTPVVDIKPYIV